jgi:hypothetical protein
MAGRRCEIATAGKPRRWGEDIRFKLKHSTDIERLAIVRKKKRISA